ncbi:MAG: hypothetical protein MK211_08675 [Flavobacteriales bacterium]|uniref:hypothetical protein n=1 Tax=Candidatus Ulvibacter alkanivorans TaxID=2267620 RepID=UPI000DF3AB3C|nr:hypothetical protein [Candidatus Ulvibacter alkanivorans]MCH2490209.1 hypothetical protein [Flavobacteriales bacterium]
MQLKKYITLGVLFILPITMYLFFASGKDNFGRLPTLTTQVNELDAFTTLDGEKVKLEDQITVLGFFGKDPLQHKANAFNLTHKIYKKNREFHDFQFVILVAEGSEAAASELKEKLSEIVAVDQWKFAVGTTEAIQEVFQSLETNYTLSEEISVPYVFIIDKKRNLRGRDDDEDVGVLYGFDARDYSEINNKMGDDVKVILAEYRLALKKYKADREI